MRHRGTASGLPGAGVAGAQGSRKSPPGAVEQTIPPPVPQNPQLPPLHLTDDQRTKIREVLSSKHTEVSFALKSTKAAQSFEPSVGKQIPKGLKPLALPPPLAHEMPPLGRYAYLKFKHQILIVNPLTRKIADMFPE